MKVLLCMHVVVGLLSSTQSVRLEEISEDCVDGHLFTQPHKR